MTAPITPRLTPATLKDEHTLDDAIDAVLTTGTESATLRRKILRRQRALRRLVDDVAWRRYLDVEQAVNERSLSESRRIARWAFMEGRRR